MKPNRMNSRRELLALTVLGGTALLARNALAAGACADGSSAAGSALLDRYVAAINAHDTGSFPEIHTESYIQNSGRGPRLSVLKRHATSRLLKLSLLI